ncbi:MAG: ATP-binding protein [Janthinobacterium lividum]
MTFRPHADDELALLLPHLERLDLLLQREMHQTGVAAADPLRLHAFLLPADEVETRLRGPLGLPAWLAQPADAMPEPVAARGRLRLLMARFGLSDIERDVLLLAMLPRLDDRYGTLFAYVQHKSAGRQPTLDLALRLLCPDGIERLAVQAALSRDAPVFRHGCLSDVRDQEASPSPAALQLDIAIHEFLLGCASPVFPECCALLEMADEDVATSDDVAFVANAWRDVKPRETPHAQTQAQTQAPGAAVILRGDPDSGRAAVLAAAARLGGRIAVRCELTELPDGDDDAWPVLMRVLRDARLWDAVLIFDALDRFAQKHPALLRRFATRVDAHPVPVGILARRHGPLVRLGRRPHVLHTVSPRSFDDTFASVRGQLENLVGKTRTHAGLDPAALVRRFHPAPSAVRETLAEAELYRRGRGPRAALRMSDLNRAFGLRAQADFGHLAQRITPARTFADLVVAPPVAAHLEEIIAALRQRDHALALGFDRKLGTGTGISVLFHGPSGTGKTLACEVLAEALGVDLIRIDLSTVVNKYIGETEKHLSRIFDLAARDGGVLFFDEADALFGKRTQTKDAQDRHANIEVSYLLQRLENHPGLVALSTNHREHLDDAFTRRLTFVVEVPFPDVGVRERLWRGIWPAGVRLDDGIDFAALARAFAVSGGSIRNIALRATWMAAEQGAAGVASTHVEEAARREYAKLGRLWPGEAGGGRGRPG